MSKMMKHKIAYALLLTMVLGAGLGYALDSVSWNSSDPKMTSTPVMTNIPVDIVKELQSDEEFRRALDAFVETAQSIDVGLLVKNSFMNSRETAGPNGLIVSIRSPGSTSFERLNRILEEVYGPINKIVCEDAANQPIEKCGKIRLFFE